MESVRSGAAICSPAYHTWMVTTAQLAVTGTKRRAFGLSLPHRSRITRWRSSVCSGCKPSSGGPTSAAAGVVEGIVYLR